MQQDLAKKPSLLVQRAFVVQFRDEADVEQKRFEGRVEHIVSGQVTRFHSLEELLTFFAQIINQGRVLFSGDSITHKNHKIKKRRNNHVEKRRLV